MTIVQDGTKDGTQDGTSIVPNDDVTVTDSVTVPGANATALLPATPAPAATATQLASLRAAARILVQGALRSRSGSSGGSGTATFPVPPAAATTTTDSGDTAR